MTYYILRRLVLLVPVLLGVTVIVFILMALIPGDPALAILGPYANPDSLARIRSELGLDRSLPEQYVIWLGNLLSGDFGRSHSLSRPVIDEVMARIGPTFLLAGAALVIASVVGLGAGVVSAVRQRGWQDKALTLLVLIGISTPSFWLGLMLMLLFAVELKWFPVSGMFAVYGGGGALDLARHLVLPAVTLGVVAAGVIARLTRTSMLEVLRADFVRTARAKGETERRVVYAHAFRAAIATIVPVVGIQIGFLLGGAVYIETVFQWPGIGRMLVNAIKSRDILLVQGGVLVVATAYVLINIAVDIAQRALDPRIGA